MKHFILFAMLAVCLSTLSCNKETKQSPIIEDSQPQVNITIKTDKEQFFLFYDAGSFVAGDPYEECDAPWLRVDHTFSFDGNSLTIDDDVFKVIKYIHHSGFVFKDTGGQEIHLITIKQSDNDSETTISISKVINGNKTKWIVNIPGYDEMGVLCSLRICTD